MGYRSRSESLFSLKSIRDDTFFYIILSEDKRRIDDLVLSR